MKNRSLFNPLHWLSILLGFIRDVYWFVHRHIESSIRMQLILTFVFCLLAALIARSVSTPLFADANKYPTIDYSAGVHEIDSRARSILNDINDEYSLQERPGRNASATAMPIPEQKVTDIIARYNQWNPNMKILLLDLDGKVLYKSANATESKVDLHSIIRNAMDARINDRRYQNQEYSSFYPLDLQNTKAYLVVSGMPSPNIVYMKGGSSPMPTLLAFVTFIILFFWITKRKTKYIEIGRASCRERVL